MKTLPLSAAVLAAGLVVSGSAAADDRNRDDSESNNALVVAVFGDWPYNDLLLANAGLLTRAC